MSHVKGLDSFLDVLELVKNPTKFEAKIAELKDATAKYDEAIKSVVGLANVNDYIQGISARDAESKRLHKEAEVTANKMVSDAHDEAASIKKLSKDKVDKIQVREEAVTVLETSLKAKEKVLNEKEGVLNTLNQTLLAKEASLASIEQELSERKAKIIAAMG